ncbi:MAG: DUF2283 domain-containing protein [Desulfovermiculus sp.]
MSCEVADDILFIRLSEKKITKEISQDWNTTHISYAQDGTIVEVVVLEASKQGAWPLQESGGIKAALAVEQYLILQLVQKIAKGKAQKNKIAGCLSIPSDQLKHKEMLCCRRGDLLTCPFLGGTFFTMLAIQQGIGKKTM